MKENGTVQIGDFTASLTAETVAALHELITKCGIDGRTFTLRFGLPSTGETIDFEIAPGREIDFSFSAEGIDSGLITSQAAKLLDSVIETGSVVVVVLGE